MRRFAVLFVIAWAVACAWASEAAGTPAPDRLSSDTASPGPMSGADSANDRHDGAIATLNAIRRHAGAGTLAPSPALETSASRHAAYLDANGLRSAATVHDETPGLAAFSGPDPFVRMRAAGYQPSYATEVVGNIGSASPDATCIDNLMNTVYHAALLLSRVTQVGLAFGSGRYAGMCTIDLGAPFDARDGQPPAPGEVVTYPYAGMTVASGTYAVAAENPRPPLGWLPNAKAGTPVLVGFRNEDYVAADAALPRVVIDRFALSDAAGTLVPSVVLADAAIGGPGVNVDRPLHGGFAVLVPLHPLPAGRYSVSLSARVVGGHSLALSSWWFQVAAP